MFLEEIRQYCLDKPFTAWDFPFDEHVLAIRVKGKIFLLSNVNDDPVELNLKCDPARAEALRDEHPDHIRPGYHMNKRHWNTITVDDSFPDELLLELIDHSFACVLKGLKKADRDAVLDALKTSE